MPTASKARVGQHPGYTRFVLEIDGPVSYSYYTVAKPRRVVIEFADLAFDVSAESLARLPGGAIDVVRVGAGDPGPARVVLGLTAASSVRKVFTIDPTDGYGHRFVLDLEPIDDAAFAETARPMLLAQMEPVPAVEAQAAADPAVGETTPPVVADEEPTGQDPSAAAQSDPVQTAQVEDTVAYAGPEAQDDDSKGGWAEPVVAEVSGYVLVEGRYFPRPPRYDGQERNSVSAAVEPEFYIEWEDYTNLTVTPFMRIDSADNNRTHFDLREGYLQTVGDDWEFGIGVSKVFWGVTESVHLVDIINQTDLVEDIDLEEKLGQPMVDLTLIRDWGYLDFFYLPYFRERTFPGRAGRFRGPLVVDETQSEYTSGAERWHPDFAVRYSNSIGDWDGGLYYFYGTSRDPTLSVGFNSSMEPVLIPEYELINQVGTDIQYTTGAWLWKLEALFRQGQKNRVLEEENYYATAGGLEYTFFGIFETNADFGVIGEYLRDSRLKRSPGAFQNDVFLGGRLGLNDPQDTSLLFGVIKDVTYTTSMYSAEASRRLGESFRIALDVRVFTNVDRRDPLFGIRDDDFVQLELGYYF